MSAPKVTRPIVSNPNKSDLEEQSEELKNSDEDEEFRRMITAKLQQLKGDTNISQQHKEMNKRKSMQGEQEKVNARCESRIDEDTELLKKCKLKAGNEKSKKS